MTDGKRDLDALIEEITVDCYGEDEELIGFLTYLEDALEWPVEAAVVGVPAPVTMVKQRYGRRRAFLDRLRRAETAPIDDAAERGAEVVP